VIRTYDYYKYLPEGKQGLENNLIIETPTKVKIDLRSKIVVIESSSDLIDTLLIKSSFRNIQFKSKLKNIQSLIVYSKSQSVSGMLQLNYESCFFVLKDLKLYLKKSIQSKQLKT